MSESFIALPGRLPAPAWVIHAIVGSMLLLSGLSALRTGTAYWLDWVKVIFGLLTVTGMVWVLLQRLRHGPPRLEVRESGLCVRAGQLSGARDVLWSDVEHILLGTEEAQLKLRDGDTIFVPTLSPDTVTRVRELLTDSAETHSIELTQGTGVAEPP